MDLGVGRVSHTFLVIPECPYPLLGRDLLAKVGAQIHFQAEGPAVTDREGRPLQVLTLKLKDEYRLYENPPHLEGVDIQQWMTKTPLAWAEISGMGMAQQQPPVVVEIKASSTPISVRQYPMSKEARDGIRPHIQRLLKLGILVKCQSA